MIDFSTLETGKSKFNARLSESGGYIEFSNTSKKYFTLGLSAFLKILNDILTNNIHFVGHEKYVEEDWRNLGSKYYTDATAKASCTVQSKPMFSTLSKIVMWANSETLDENNPEKIIRLDMNSIKTSIEKLTDVIENFTPKKGIAKVNLKKEPKTIKEFTVLRHFAKYVFEYFYKDWKIVIDSSISKSHSINEKGYTGYDFEGFPNLIAEFTEEQTQGDLKSSETNRFIAEPLKIDNDKFYYFTSQWNGNGEYNLSFLNLKKHFESKFPNYKIERLRDEQSNKDMKFWLEKVETKQIVFDSKAFQESTKEAGLNFSDTLITRFVSSLCTKPFVILSGLSGSGKTKLAQCFAQWICEDKSQYIIVPVGADWTNREPLLGFPNALNKDEYVKPENGVLDLLLEANKNSDKPYFLILDEMNLSHVERYFADFLSVMESKNCISLHSGNEEEINIPQKICLPSNIFIIGTVNIDETTYMFSPKVLDRANTIEFRLNEEEINEYLSNPTIVKLSKLVGSGASMSSDFLSISMNGLKVEKNDTIKDSLLEFFGELKKSGAEFGYRTAGEIYRLIQQLGKLDSNLKIDDKLDIAIMQKLLPKLHGSRRKLEPILETLGGFCINGEKEEVKNFFNHKEENDYSDTGKVKFPLSLEKIVRMHKGAIDNGFASYAEA